MSLSMSPADLMDWYQNLIIPPDKEKGRGQATVNVHLYRNNGLTGRLGTTDAMGPGGPKDALLGDIKEALKPHRLGTTPLDIASMDNGERISIDVFKLVRVFTGKGSPTDIIHVLWLARHFGKVDRKPEDDKKGHKARADSYFTLQTYCDRYVGLDCNGFVGNYVGGVLGVPKIEPNTSIQSYPGRGKARKTIEEVEPLDILIWADYGHIAIFDSIELFDPDGKPLWTAVESTAAFGGGLHQGPYQVKKLLGKKDGRQLFGVDRGIKGAGLSSVFIIGDLA